ncbi:MAG: transglutaminase domain protein [Massilibacillus sp.]|nr:transglutaminase domain protein [Massilibacillus sp.]
MKKFLEENNYIDFHSMIIQENDIFDMRMSDEEKARAAFEFVRDKIPHSFDCKATVITAKASEVLKYKTGICHAKSNLLAALLRSQGIPTGFRYQHLTLLNDDSAGYCLHCYNAIYI